MLLITRIVIILVIIQLPAITGQQDSAPRQMMNCEPLSQTEKQKRVQQLRSDVDFNWTFYMLPPLTSAREPVVKTPMTNQRSLTSESILYLGSYGKMCPDKNNSEVECPAHYVLNRDLNRIPEVMVHAKCNCKECILSPKETNGCKLVTVLTPVMRRNESSCDYTSMLEAVPVSCECAIK
ncbi:hypothetical protein DPMN_166058 [Dreissena polymorpha]|uniref:CTCK domain-containing protein n=1 Tax=Dreissena polymorpha TaxID=45954 RepID=A0A9D4F0U9_DREPO|nr:hypothetical protein DPMN_166058 [Dreissena polymorpha]